MTAIDALGYLAAGIVLATFCTKSMATLRWFAIASNRWSPDCKRRGGANISSAESLQTCFKLTPPRPLTLFREEDRKRSS
jgi:hypothetical protein